MKLNLVIIVLAAGTALAEEALVRAGRATRCPRIQNFNGKVKYKSRGRKAVFKCSRTSVRYGPANAICLSTSQWSVDPPVCISAQCGPLTDIPDNLIVTETFGGALLSFSCKEEYQIHGPTEIFCAQATWNSLPPTCKATAELTECDFETDDNLCGWTQDDDEELEWTRHQGLTPTGNTGPSRDHTHPESETGYYMYVEMSSPAQPQDQARLLSPIYSTKMSEMCFDFWYHILGPDDEGHVGVLDVYVQGVSQFLDDLQPLFSKEGNQGTEWQRGWIYIDEMDEPFQIVIVATRKMSYFSDIAIDDVRLYNCTESTTPDTTTTSTTPLPTTSTTSVTTAGQVLVNVTTAGKSPSGSPSTVKSSTTVLVQSVSTTKTAANQTSVSVTPTQESPPETTSATSTPAIATSTKMRQQSTLAPQTVTTEPPTEQPTTEILQTTEKQGTTEKVTTLTSVATKPPTKEQTTRTTKVQKTTTQPKTTTTAIPTTVKVTSIQQTSTTAPTTTQSTTTTTQPQAVTTAATEAQTTSAGTSKMTVKTTDQTTVPQTTVTLPISTTVKLSTKTTKAATTTSSTQMTTHTHPPYTSAKAGPTTESAEVKTTTTTVKPTAALNSTTSSSIATSNITSAKGIPVAQTKTHPDDETLKPLLIGLGVGIVAGLIIIGVVAWVCVRRRKFYTSRYADELKPITHSSSSHSLNNVQYYHDDEEYQT